MLTIASKTLTAQRTWAKRTGRYPEAEELFQKLSVSENVQFLFGPMVVGTVEFQQKDGSVGTLPLWLMRHGGHCTLDYEHGFQGVNHRLDCHCGHRRYFSDIGYHLKLLVNAFKAAHAMRKARLANTRAATASGRPSQ